MGVTAIGATFSVCVVLACRIAKRKEKPLESLIPRLFRRLAKLYAVVAILCVSSAWAGLNTWTSLGPEGGMVTKILLHKTNASIVYATTAGGFYRSTNGGANWVLVESDFFNVPQDIALDPINTNRLFVATPNALFVSNDSGASLHQLMTLPFQQGITQIETNSTGSALYVTISARLLYSPDSGATWQERSPIPVTTGVVSLLVADPALPDVLFAITNTAAGFVSVDGGLSWQSQILPISAGIYDFAIDPTNTQVFWAATSDGVWRSTNRGANWTLTSSGAAGAAFAVAFDPINTAVAYAGHSASIYKTVDAGAHWTVVGAQTHPGQIASIVVRDQQALVGGRSGIWATMDGGVSWVARNSGLKASQVLSMSAAAGSDRIYLNAGDVGFHYLSAGSLSTAAVNIAPLRTFLNPLAIQSSSIVAQAQNQPSQDRLFANSANGFFGLFRSFDAGASWTFLAPSIFNGKQVQYVVDFPTDENIIFASTTTGTYRSADGGDTWQSVTGLPSTAVASVITASNSGMVAYAGIFSESLVGSYPGYGVYKSTDAGSSWIPANTGITTSYITSLVADPYNDQVVYAGTATGLLKTTNGGASWSPLPWVTSGGADVQSLAIDPLHSRIIYAARPGVIARSVDAGVTWERLIAPGTSLIWIPNAMLVDPQRSDTLLVAADGHGVQQFVVAPDLAIEAAPSLGAFAYGASVTHQYTVRNLGPYDATGVMVSVSLPSSASGISVTAPGGSCSTVMTTITCVLDVVRVSAASIISISETNPNQGVLSISASIHGDQRDADGSNNAVVSQFTVTEVSDLSVTATAPAASTEGDTISYVLVANNSGPNTATGVTVQYQLASGLTAGSVTTTRGACVNTSGLITCSMSSLDVGGSATISFSATPASTGTYAGTAQIYASGIDANANNNSAATSTAVGSRPASSGGGSVSWSMLLMLGALSLVTRHGDVRRITLRG